MKIGRKKFESIDSYR